MLSDEQCADVFLGHHFDGIKHHFVGRNCVNLGTFVVENLANGMSGIHGSADFCMWLNNSSRSASESLAKLAPPARAHVSLWGLIIIMTTIRSQHVICNLGSRKNYGTREIFMSLYWTVPITTV